MIVAFAAVLVMVLAAIGLGHLLLGALVPRLAEARPLPVGMAGLAGLGLAALTATVVNFIAPVTWYVAVALLGIGLARFAIIFRAVQREQWLFLAAAAVVMALLAPSLPLGADGGLYHLPAQLWLVEEKIVFGLANLHGRFGFNSLNEPLLALGWLPGNELLLARLMSGLIAILVLALTLDLARSASGEPDLRYLGAFAGAGFAFAWLHVALRVGWLNTDVSPAAYSLASALIGYAAIRRSDASLLVVSFLFAALATMSKGSAVIVMLVPLAAAAVMGARRGWAAFPWLPIALIGVLLLPWVAHGFIVSGCLYFPSAVSCLPVPWSARAAAEQLTLWVIAWARAPDTGLVHATGWAWLPVWFGAEKLRLLGLVLAALAGAALGVAMPRGPRQEHGLAAPVILSAWAVLAVGFWFLVAPALRFGIAPILLLAAIPGLWVTILRAGSGGRQVPNWPAPAVMALGLIGAIAVAGSPVRLHRDVLFPGTVDVPEVEVIHGGGINWTANGQCYRAPRPCATGESAVAEQWWNGYRVYLAP